MTELESWTHDITPRYQEHNVNGCWWACCQMLIRYQRQADHFIERPGQVDAVFRASARREVMSTEQLYIDPGIAPLEGYPMRDRNGNPLVSSFAQRIRFLHPSHWWQHGIPPDPIHLGMLARLVSLQHVPGVTERPYGPEVWLDTIRHRPLILMFIVGERQSDAGAEQLCHAVLGTGVRYEVKPNGTRDIDRAEVYILDPNRSALSGWYGIQALQLLPAARGYAAMYYRGGTYHAADRGSGTA